MSVKDARQGVAKIAQTMPAIRHLNRIRSTGPHAVGIVAGPIPGDDLDAGMRLQPRLDSLRPAVTQQINRLVLILQIDDDGAVASARRYAQSSMPMTRGDGASGMGAARIGRSSVSPLTGMASRLARRAPASPPACRAMRRCASARRTVRRTLGRATSGRRSTKIRCGHLGAEQRKRRIWGNRGDLLRLERHGNLQGVLPNRQHWERSPVRSERPEIQLL